MANGAALIGALLGEGVGGFQIARESRQAQERIDIEKRARDLAEERERLTAGLNFTFNVFNNIKDPEQAQSLLKIAKPSLDALGVDVSDFQQALTTVPGTGPLISQYLSSATDLTGGAAVRSQVQLKLTQRGLGALIPKLDEQVEGIQRSLVTKEAAATQKAIGLPRGEALERAREDVAPGLSRAAAGLGEIPAVDAELRDLQMDKMRAEIENINALAANRQAQQKRLEPLRDSVAFEMNQRFRAQAGQPREKRPATLLDLSAVPPDRLALMLGGLSQPENLALLLQMFGGAGGAALPGTPVTPVPPAPVGGKAVKPTLNAAQRQAVESAKPGTKFDLGGREYTREQLLGK